MSELSQQFSSETDAINTVDKRSDNLIDQGKDAASNLSDITKETDYVQKDGTLDEEKESNQSSYTRQEFQAMTVEDKKNFLSELQSVSKEQSPMIALELKRNKKNGELFKLAMAYSKTEQQLQQKMEAFQSKKADIKAEHDKQTAEITEEYQKDEQNIRLEYKDKNRQLAAQLKANQNVGAFRQNAQQLRSAESFFGVQRTDEMKQGVETKRDEVKDAPEVSELIQKISELPAELNEKLQDRKQQLLAEMAAIEQNTKQEMGQLKGSTLAEVNEIKQQLSEIEQKRDQAETEFADLESQIEDKQRLKDSVDALKDELREFSFSDGKEVMEDLENRAANTISMESLSADKETFEAQLEDVMNGVEKLNADLEVAEDEAVYSNRASYDKQANELDDEHNSLFEEKANSHEDLKKELNEPFAEAVERARTATDLREGTNAIDLIASFSGLSEEAKKAGKKIGKSQEALNKFATKLEQRFGKLRDKLGRAENGANQEIYKSSNSIFDKIYTAQTIAEEAKAGDFSKVSVEDWLKKTFSKLFSRR